MQKIIIVGYFSEMVELCENAGFTIVGYTDKEKKNSNYLYLGTDNDLITNKASYKKYPLVVTPDLPGTRKQLFNKLKDAGFVFKTILSPKANISKSAIIDDGVVVQDFCNISSNVHLCEGVKVNTYANIMHDCQVASFATIAPSAVLLGRVKIGREAYVGSNSTTLPELSIGEESTIGAGAVVTKDVPPKTTVVGVPAKKLH